MNPRAFFKKGRVFITPWPGLYGITEMAWFAVVKPKGTYSICLRIYATHMDTAASEDYGIIVPIDGNETQFSDDYQSFKKTIHIKIENPGVMVGSDLHINFAPPFTVDHNIKVQNVGRVYGDSVKHMEDSFAESLGLVKHT